MNDDLKPPLRDDTLQDMEGGFLMSMLIVLRLRDNLLASKDTALTPSESANIVVDCISVALTRAVDDIKEVADAWEKK